MHLLPVFCQYIPAHLALEGTGYYVFRDMAQLPEAIEWLESQSSFRQTRRCRRLFDPAIIYSRYYDPFLQSIPLRKS